VSAQVELIEAVVHAGEMVTPYLRAGRGAPLVLITQRDRAALESDALVNALAAKFCVIVPQRPATAGESWLQHMIEGLGLEQPRVLVESGEGLT
jgi:hypothetical protein